jgi:hypothetical protein
MICRSISIATLVAILFCTARAPAAQDGVKEYSIVITKPDAEYTIDVGGTMDPENIEIVVENLGEQPAASPRLTVNGLYDWYDVHSMVNEITRGCQTDEEKALAIWSWVQDKRWQRESHDDSSLHPVRGLNGYGYGICGNTAAWISALCRAVSLKTRVWELTGHTVAEVYFDGGWHMLDGNAKVFYLDRDNKTIASIDTLQKDKWLIERTIHPTDPWFRGPDPDRNEQFKHYLITERDNWISDGYDSEFLKNYTMSMTLKPGEKLVRWWQPLLNKFEGRDKDPEVPEKYANGQLIWEPDLGRVDMRNYLDVSPVSNVATRIQDGRNPAIHVAALQDGFLYDRASKFAILIHSPYPVVGGRFRCTLVKEGSSQLDQASLSFAESDYLYDFRIGAGSRNVEVDLDSAILRHAPVYDYSIEFAIRGNANSNPPTQAGVDAFRSVTDLQVSPHSLPALRLGKNLVHYWDDSAGPRTIRITHRWREIADHSPPGNGMTAVDPADGGEVQTLEPILKWTAPDAPGAPPTDYQVMVCFQPECRWPVSPTLYRNVGSARSEWRVPATFLNPATSYYWKVRARDRDGHIGQWSRTFVFTTSRQSK